MLPMHKAMIDDGINWLFAESAMTMQTKHQ